MPIDLLADIDIFYKMVLKRFVEIIQAKWIDVWLCSFKNIFEDAIMF